jgi:hypothetical protein
MLDWAKQLLETVLGKTVAGLIGIFFLGAVSAWYLPRWLVTTDAFAQEVTDIYNDMKQGDTWQELKVIKLQKDIWTRQRYELEDKIDSQGFAATVRQQNRMEEFVKEIDKLTEEEKRLEQALKK